MADRPRLAAERRTITGKKVARLRKEGRLPAVVFGHGTDSEPVMIDAHAFDQLRRRTGRSTLVDLSVDGGDVRPVLLQGIQIHPLTRRPLHVDLFVVRMTEELTVEVQLVAEGAAPAAAQGGSLVHPVSMIKVRALPANLPESIHYDLGSLATYDDTITVADLAVPEGVTILADTADVIARVLEPREEIVEEVVVALGEEPVVEPEAEPAAEA
ncbi:MAG: 50S ribosomal protein L25 [Chloroflexi bacterium]|nr:50S ribosomal protein L25 [Chloroflexota bacterium]